MTVHPLTDLKTPIGDILKAAGSNGVVLESGERKQYALIPLDEDLIDYLIERNPKFMEECRKIRERMRLGEYRTHEEVKALLGK